MTIWTPEIVPEGLGLMVNTANVDLAPVNVNGSSDWYTGGSSNLEPWELQKIATDFLVSHLGLDSFKRRTAISIAKATGDFPVLESRQHKKVPFEYIVGIHHNRELPYSQIEDVCLLNQMTCDLPEFFGFRTAAFSKITPEVLARDFPDARLYTYDTITMGRTKLRYGE